MGDGAPNLPCPRRMLLPHRHRNGRTTVMEKGVGNSWISQPYCDVFSRSKSSGTNIILVIVTPSERKKENERERGKEGNEKETRFLLLWLNS